MRGDLCADFHRAGLSPLLLTGPPHASLRLISADASSLAAMSIDFGSQFIKMALVKPGVPMEMVLNEDASRKTRNLLTIRDGEYLFGDTALAFSVRYPEYSFSYLLDLLGKHVDNPIVALYRRRFPHSKIILDDARDVVQLEVDGESFDVETLIAMVLRQCRRIVEKFAKQSVRDVIITVPAFFTQTERRSLVAATEIAELNLLQLMTDYTAAGLNYGAFRRSEITEKPQTLLIYDVGASKVTASVLEYVLVPEKQGTEKNPMMTTLGIGYDRTLGGFEITQRLRDMFVNEFRKKKKTKTDVTQNARAMAKLFEEAERIKIILSANVNITAQVEGVHEEQHFMMPLTRQELEESISDLEPKFVQPIVDALKMAELSPEQIDHVVLMGGGTRVPRLRQLLQKFFKGKELGRFLNTDDAIAMGGVYQAAHLSKGFKVKKFDVRDLQIFPVQVDFMSTPGNDNTVPGRLIRRPIYPYKSFIPASKKVLSFTSFTRDFSIYINYGDMKHLRADQIRQLASLNISEVKIEGVTEAYASEAAKDGTTFKGIKTRFSLDNSGILHLGGAEMLLERSPKTKSAFACKTISLYKRKLQSVQKSLIDLSSGCLEGRCNLWSVGLLFHLTGFCT
ncbi:unnamed protein product [Gongylonema pulchrum]|uniref:Hypoxia up-regulated protein 1 n=1 Tax=Gongylonema pulchrum TaxID=637853 RepID=A0A183EKD2_9BILA|nr:unnamed protein product [Gongylonema pulchrum]